MRNIDWKFNGRSVISSIREPMEDLIGDSVWVSIWLATQISLQWEVKLPTRDYLRGLLR